MTTDNATAYEVEINGRPVAVTGDEATLRDAVGSHVFSSWVKTLDPRFVVRAVTIQSVDRFGPRVGFVKWKADLIDPAGNYLPGIVFGRGPAVAILAVLVCEEKEYVLLTNQARAPIGAFEYDEIIAGMTDGEGDLTGVAAKELKEETGIVLNKRDLFPLSEEVVSGSRGIYPSPGGCDEYLAYYLWRKEVTREEISELQGKLTGLREEGEMITLTVMPITEACTRLTDGKFWTAFGLYAVARAQRRIE